MYGVCVCVCLCSKAGNGTAHSLRHTNNEAVLVSNLTFSDDTILLSFLIQWANDMDDLWEEN